MAADAIAELHLLGVNPLFRIYDPEAWQVLDIHRLYLRQPSINIMPHEDDESIRFNAQYRDYLVELFTLCGNNAEAIAVSRADAAIRVEFEIASILRPDPQSPRKMYNKRSQESSRVGSNPWISTYGCKSCPLEMKKNWSSITRIIFKTLQSCSRTSIMMTCHVI
jgi:hypothetical protein